jgi:hypothetical protein
LLLLLALVADATADTLVRDDLIFTSSLLPFIVVSSVAMLFSRGGEGAVR